MTVILLLLIPKYNYLVHYTKPFTIMAFGLLFFLSFPLRFPPILFLLFPLRNPFFVAFALFNLFLLLLMWNYLRQDLKSICDVRVSDVISSLALNKRRREERGWMWKKKIENQLLAEPFFHFYIRYLNESNGFT